MFLLPLVVLAVAILVGVQVGTRVGDSAASEVGVAAVVSLALLGAGLWMVATFGTKRRRRAR